MLSLRAIIIIVLLVATSARQGRHMLQLVPPAVTNVAPDFTPDATPVATPAATPTETAVAAVTQAAFAPTDTLQPVPVQTPAMDPITDSVQPPDVVADDNATRGNLTDELVKLPQMPGLLGRSAAFMCTALQWCDTIMAWHGMRVLPAVHLMCMF